MFLALLNFSWSLATKCVLLNNEPCIIRPTLIDLSSVVLNHYPFMISLDKCNRSCNAVNDLPTKICIASKAKDTNDKVFLMITRANEAKTLVSHISCTFKRKFNSKSCNSDQME